jgi:hypothetical protein
LAQKDHLVQAREQRVERRMTRRSGACAGGVASLSAWSAIGIESRQRVHRTLIN